MVDDGNGFFQYEIFFIAKGEHADSFLNAICNMNIPFVIPPKMLAIGPFGEGADFFNFSIKFTYDPNPIYFPVQGLIDLCKEHECHHKNTTSTSVSPYSAY